MTHPAAAPHTVLTRLEPGQALRLHLDRHTTLVVAKGAVMAVAPSLWMGECVFSEHTRLDEGQALSPSRSGWMEVVATSDAPVELSSYRETGAALAPSWRWMAAALLQRMRALRGVS